MDKEDKIGGGGRTKWSLQVVPPLGGDVCMRPCALFLFYSSALLLHLPHPESFHYSFLFSTCSASSSFVRLAEVWNILRFSVDPRETWSWQG